MKALKILSIIFLFGCSTTSNRSRMLSKSEISQLGINGMAYDLRLCPTVYDAKMKATRENGPCELVDCQEKEGAITCLARPEPKSP